MGNGLVFLLRGRKLSGGARSREATAGRSQWQADGQPPAGAGQTASHGLPLVVLHLLVCTAALSYRYVPLIINIIVNISFISCGVVEVVLLRKSTLKTLCLSISFSTLTETLRTMDLSVLQPFLPGQPQLFAHFLDKALGVQCSSSISGLISQ